jgi:hypothetical protein
LKTVLISSISKSEGREEKKMRKNRGENNLRLIYVTLVAVVVTTVMAFNLYAIYDHCGKKSGIVPTKKSIWEENLEDTDAIDMSKILKKYLIRSI